MRQNLLVASILCSATAAFAAPGRLPVEAVPEHYAITLAPHLATLTFDGHERIRLRVAKPTQTVTLNAADYTVTRAAVADNVATIKQDADTETVTLSFARRLLMSISKEMGAKIGSWTFSRVEAKTLKIVAPGSVSWPLRMRSSASRWPASALLSMTMAASPWPS